MKDLALRALDAVARRGVTYADVRAVDSRQRDISTKNGKTGHVSSAESAGLGIRVLAHGCWGFAATDNLTADGIESAAALALSIAQAGTVARTHAFKSNPPAMTEVVAGRVNMMFTDIAAAQGLLKSGEPETDCRDISQAKRVDARPADHCRERRA